MNEYQRGIEDALDLVYDRILRYEEKHKDKLPKDFVLSIKEIIQNVKDSKIVKLERELLLVD